MLKELKDQIVSLEYDDELHEYVNLGIKHMPTTELLQKMGISRDFSDISWVQAVENARNRGIAIHKAINEHAIKDPRNVKYEGEYLEVSEFFRELPWDVIGEFVSEQKLLDKEHKVAGTADFIYKYATDADSSTIVIMDIKTSHTVDLWEAAWQLSIYKYMLKQAIPDCAVVILQVATFSKDAGHISLHDVSDYIPESEVVKLLDAYRNGLPYDNGKVVLLQETRELALDAYRIAEGIKTLKSTLEYKQVALDSVREKLYVAMEKREVKTFEINGMKVSRVDGTFRKIIDSTRLKEEKPQVYEEYLKLSEVKPTVRITFPNTKGDKK
jgi:hypothetical protein